MAVINFYDDTFGEATETIEIDKKLHIRTIIKKYLNSKKKTENKLEVYDARTGKTTFESSEIHDYKCVIEVNGHEIKDLNYKVKDNDIVSIFFIPQDSEVASNALMAGGITLSVLAGMATFIPGLFAVDMIMLGVGVVAFGAGALMGLNQSSEADVDSLKSTSLLGIDSGANKSILNNKYPIILGKRKVEPYIIGSVYHLTKTSDFVNCTDEGQYFRALYCIGYGPLKLTNFKIGDTVLAYNTDSADGYRKQILHGQLHLDKSWISTDSGTDEQKTRTNNDTFDITTKWKNNDVKLEILQFGEYANAISDERLKISNLYGTIYPETVLEKKIDASILFAYDKSLSDVSQVIYKNVGMLSGYRTNTVRLSDACPRKIQVEIDMPSGYYGVRTDNSNEDGTITQYEQVPLLFAVQWRFASNGEASSVAEDGHGWNSFQYMTFNDGSKVYPSPYTTEDSREEIESNLGLSDDTEKTVYNAETGNYEGYNADWVGVNVFNLMRTGDGDWSKTHILNELEVLELEDEGIIVTDPSMTYTYSVDTAKKSSNYPYITADTTYGTSEGYTIKEGYENTYRCVLIDGLYYIEQNEKSYYQKWYSKREYREWNNNEDYNIKERRYVFETVFTEAQCRLLAGYTSSNYYDKVEVRVIRLSPCYIDQTDTDSTIYSNETYQDFIKWTYLRTWTFDKEEYLKALKNSDGDVSVNDYISRPIPEEDLNKFTYVAIELKQDEAETGGSSLEQLSCIAQSFAPNYNEQEDKWYPEEIEEKYGYYKKVKDSSGNWSIQDFDSKEEYEAEYKAAIGTDEIENYFSYRNGTTYLEQIRKDIISGINVIDDYSISNGMLKFGLDGKTETKYLSNNTASIALQLLLGAHLKEDAKTYNDVDLEAFSEAYKFYRDVTDNYPQSYSQDSQFATTVNLKSASRLKTASAMISAGWNDESTVEANGWKYTAITEEYYTTFSLAFSNDTEDKYYIVTPITDNKILTPAELAAERTSILNGENATYNILLATLSGGSIYTRGSLYEQALHYVQDIYYLRKNDFQSYLDTFADYPVNAVQAGCYDTEIFNFMDAYDDGIPHIYKDYIINVLEQMSMFKASDNVQHVSFRANAVITKEVKLESLMQKILLTGRSYLKRTDDNKYEPLIGRPQPYPVTVLSQRNCVGKSNTRTFDDTPSGYLNSFEDEDDDYETNTFYVMDNGEKWYAPKKKIEDFNLDYVTNRNQMRLLSTFNFASKLYQRENYSRTITRLGYSLGLGDTVLLQDDSLLAGTDNGGRIEDLIEDDDYIYGFIIDEAYMCTGAEGDDVQGVTVIQPEEFGNSRCVTLKLAKLGTTVTLSQKVELQDGSEETETFVYTVENKYTNVVLFDKKVAKSDGFVEVDDSQFVIIKPEAGNLVVFGDYTAMSEKAVVMGIKPSKNNFEITLVPYNESLYFAGAEIPVFIPTMTRPSRETESYAFTDNPTKDMIAERNANLLTATANYNIKIVHLYKQSTEELLTADIQCPVTYKFSDNTITFEDESKANGWFSDASSITDRSILYTTTATASSLSDTDTIAVTEWSAPTKTGTDGINTSTIRLVKQTENGSAAPALPASKATYSYSTHQLVWEDESKANGWVIENAYSGASKGKLTWMTMATVSSSNSTDDIEPSEWSSPVYYTVNGSYTDYVFTVGPFGLSDEKLISDYTWYDKPPATTDDNPCLYMAQKYISL